MQNAEEVHQNWEQIKAAEKGETPDQAQRLSRKLSRYARTLPPLTAGMKISQKATVYMFKLCICLKQLCICLKINYIPEFV